MAINIKTPPPQVDQSAHDEAAAAIETEVATTKTKAGQDAPLSQTVDKNSEPVHIAAPMFERIDVAMGFKMPVASYTMLEFQIRRSVPFDPAVTSADDVFAATKAWVEAKLNGLIEEQQTEQAG